MLGVVLAATLSSVAAADTVTVNGISTPGVDVIGVRESRLIYLTPAGAEVRTSLTEIDELELEAYPGFAAAVAQLDEGQFGDAAAGMQAVMQAAGRDAAWVRQFAAWYRVQALDGADRGREAAGAFSALAATKPDPFFLSRPPIQSVANLRGDDRTKTVALLDRNLRRTDDAGAAAVQQLLDLLRDAPPEGPANGADTRPDPDSPTNAAAGESTTPPDAGESAVVLPASQMSAGGPVVDLLRAGKFDEALALSDRQLHSDTSRLPQRLYLRAVAQLGIADQSERREDYLDAGLGFMRVVVLSPPGGAYIGPALLETAYVHQQINEPEIAATLFEEAGLLLDEEDEPRYYQRYQDLQAP